MPEFNEENYLDSLLQEVDTKKEDYINNRDKYMHELAEKEKEQEIEQISDQELEANFIKQQVEEADEKISSESPKSGLRHSPLDLFHRMNNTDKNDENNNEDNDVIKNNELRNEEDKHVADLASNNEKIDQTLHKDTTNDDTLSKVSSHSDTDDLGLTDAEQSRLDKLNLHDIVKDVEADSVSIEQLLSSDNKKDNDSIIDEHILHDDSNAENHKPIDGIPNDLLEAAKDISNQNISNSSKKKDKKSKKKDKSNQENEINAEKNTHSGKGVLESIKNIFFEDLDDEGNKETKRSKRKKSKHNDDVNNETELTEGDDSILDESNDHINTVDNNNVNSNNNQSKQVDSKTDIDQHFDDWDKSLDENEKLLQEMYGANDDDIPVDDIQVSKKGFFAKLVYKIKENKKKNHELEKAEEEAEAQELEEKNKKKEQKKSEKAAKAAEKKAKPKKEKKPKAPKEKKPKKVKEPPKPGDILKIKPKSIVFFVLFVSGIIVLICILNFSFGYNNSLKQAQISIQNGNYQKAYQTLSGMKLKDKDQEIYRQATVVMYIQDQYLSYQNNLANNQKTRALDSLIKGLDRYNTYYNEASSLGVRKEYDSVRANIISALDQTYQLSEADATALMIMSQKDFTQYYNKIQTYGEK